MSCFLKKALKVCALSAILTALLVVTAAAGEIGIGVGAITGNDLRMRSEPSTKSTIVTYLDKGFAVTILEKLDGWYKVSYAGTTGYVSADYMIVDKDGVFETYGYANGDSVNARAAASTEAEVLYTLHQGAHVKVTGFVDGWFQVVYKDVTAYVRSDYLALTASDGSTGGSIVDLAMRQLGSDYVWGGERPGAFDCSGFTMYVYRQFGYTMSHSASSQWQCSVGTKVYEMSALQPGDLVFFNDPSRNAGKACSHVGIYIGSGQFVHASSSKDAVVTSDLTHGYYAKYFIGGKHV